jgi:osmoprotectant transport system ATP-binding protein
VIELQDVTKRYGDKVAVDDVTFEVPEGEVAVLIGPSGSGKTTTMRMINRLIEPTSGRILVNGEDITSQSPVELRRTLGYSIQSVGLFPHLTVAENIAVVPKLLKWDRIRIRARVAELLELVGLDPGAYARKYPRQLSGGEAQRVGVARALAADPPVLLMDEPFGAVDPLTRDRLQAEFARIQRELRKTVIFVTHDADEAIRLADRIVLLKDGRLQQYAAPEDLLDHPANKFVHDFMGADRALKRLGREHVADVMEVDIACVSADMSIAQIAEKTRDWKSRFVYVTDTEGRLRGWMDRKGLVAKGVTADDALTSADWREVAVQRDTTLKEALSRMLGAGFRSVPVTDGDGVLVGEVSLRAIEDTMAGGDAHIANFGTEDTDGEDDAQAADGQAAAPHDEAGTERASV